MYGFLAREAERESAALESGTPSAFETTGAREGRGVVGRVEVTALGDVALEVAPDPLQRETSFVREYDPTYPLPRVRPAGARTSER